ncbi:uncharacterized protein LOC142334276 [Lycorma delicatula]|uniref:uncharacterized protein LOC142334276 n=1 Tax=Lycorma delicatula TaxID=130591 RepID=UPI003F514DFD
MFLSCLKIYWKHVTSCFSCCTRTKSTQVKLLSPDIPLKNNIYTVRRISSFGRTPSKEDLGRSSDTNNENAGQNFLSPNPIPCDRVTLTIQPDTEEMEDCKESSSDHINIKHKKRWKKALSKVHKKSPSLKEKKEDNKDVKQNGDENIHDKNDDNCHHIDNSEEPDKKMTQKEKYKGGNWNKALSAVQKKKINKENNMLTIPSSSSSVFYSNPVQEVNNSSSLCTTKSSIDLPSMELLSPVSSKDSIWMKSQSMQDIKNIIMDEKTDKRSEIAKAHGIDLSLYQNLPVSKSAEAVDRAQQTLDALGKLDGYQEMPSGTIFFEVDYEDKKKKLKVQVEKVSKLAGRGKTNEAYNFIVKLAILGEKKSFYTKVHHYLEKKIDESFAFHIKDVHSKVLRFSVFDTKWKEGKYSAVGHALFYIEDVLQPYSKLHQMKLYKQSVPDVTPGTLQLAMSFNKNKNTICITVIKIEDIRIGEHAVGKCKIFVKIKYFSEGREVKTKCSMLMLYNEDVICNYTEHFKVDSTGMKQNYIVITVKQKLSKNMMKQDRTVGRLILGPYFYAEDGTTYTPWGKAILCDELVSHSFRLYL